MPFSPGHHTYYKVNPSQKNKIELDDNMQVTNEMKKKRLNKEETIMIPNP
jgi:galactose mutarotase-like enzyme